MATQAIEFGVGTLPVEIDLEDVSKYAASCQKVQVGQLVVQQINYPLYSGVNVVGRASSPADLKTQQQRLLDWCTEFRQAEVHGAFVDDATISSSHLLIELDSHGSQCLIRDLQSTNGTRLSSKKNAPQLSSSITYAVTPGQVLMLGNVVCRIDYHDPCETAQHPGPQRHQPAGGGSAGGSLLGGSMAAASLLTHPAEHWQQRQQQQQQQELKAGPPQCSLGTAKGGSGRGCPTAVEALVDGVAAEDAAAHASSANLQQQHLQLLAALLHPITSNPGDLDGSLARLASALPVALQQAAMSAALRQEQQLKARPAAPAMSSLSEAAGSSPQQAAATAAAAAAQHSTVLCLKKVSDPMELAADSDHQGSRGRAALRSTKGAAAAGSGGGGGSVSVVANHAVLAAGDIGSQLPAVPGAAPESHAYASQAVTEATSITGGTADQDCSMRSDWWQDERIVAGAQAVLQRAQAAGVVAQVADEGTPGSVLPHSSDIARRASEDHASAFNADVLAAEQQRSSLAEAEAATARCRVSAEALSAGGVAACNPNPADRADHLHQAVQHEQGPQQLQQVQSQAQITSGTTLKQSPEMVERQQQQQQAQQEQQERQQQQQDQALLPLLQLEEEETTLLSADPQEAKPPQRQQQQHDQPAEPPALCTHDQPLLHQQLGQQDQQQCHHHHHQRQQQQQLDAPPTGPGVGSGVAQAEVCTLLGLESEPLLETIPATLDADCSDAAPGVAGDALDVVEATQACEDVADIPLAGARGVLRPAAEASAEVAAGAVEVTADTPLLQGTAAEADEPRQQEQPPPPQQQQQQEIQQQEIQELKVGEQDLGATGVLQLYADLVTAGCAARGAGAAAAAAGAAAEPADSFTEEEPTASPTQSPTPSGDRTQVPEDDAEAADGTSTLMNMQNTDLRLAGGPQQHNWEQQQQKQQQQQQQDISSLDAARLVAQHHLSQQKQQEKSEQQQQPQEPAVPAAQQQLDITPPAEQETDEIEDDSSDEVDVLALMEMRKAAAVPRQDDVHAANQQQQQQPMGHPGLEQQEQQQDEQSHEQLTATAAAVPVAAIAPTDCAVDLAMLTRRSGQLGDVAARSNSEGGADAAGAAFNVAGVLAQQLCAGGSSSSGGGDGCGTISTGACLVQQQKEPHRHEELQQQGSTEQKQTQAMNASAPAKDLLQKSVADQEGGTAAASACQTAPGGAVSADASIALCIDQLQYQEQQELPALQPPQLAAAAAATCSPAAAAATCSPAAPPPPGAIVAGVGGSIGFATQLAAEGLEALCSTPQSASKSQSSAGRVYSALRALRHSAAAGEGQAAEVAFGFDQQLSHIVRQAQQQQDVQQQEKGTGLIDHVQQRDVPGVHKAAASSRQAAAAAAAAAASRGRRGRSRGGGRGKSGRGGAAADKGSVQGCAARLRDDEHSNSMKKRNRGRSRSSTPSAEEAEAAQPAAAAAVQAAAAALGLRRSTRSNAGKKVLGDAWTDGAEFSQQVLPSHHAAPAAAGAGAAWSLSLSMPAPPAAKDAFSRVAAAGLRLGRGQSRAGAADQGRPGQPAVSAAPAPPGHHSVESTLALQQQQQPELGQPALASPAKRAKREPASKPRQQAQRHTLAGGPGGQPDDTLLPVPQGPVQFAGGRELVPSTKGDVACVPERSATCAAQDAAVTAAGATNNAAGIAAAVAVATAAAEAAAEASAEDFQPAAKRPKVQLAAAPAAALPAGSTAAPAAAAMTGDHAQCPDASKEQLPLAIAAAPAPAAPGALMAAPGDSQPVLRCFKIPLRLYRLPTSPMAAPGASSAVAAGCAQGAGGGAGPCLVPVEGDSYQQRQGSQQQQQEDQRAAEHEHHHAVKKLTSRKRTLIGQVQSLQDRPNFAVSGSGGNGASAAAAAAAVVAPDAAEVVLAGGADAAAEANLGASEAVAVMPPVSTPARTVQPACAAAGAAAGAVETAALAACDTTAGSSEPGQLAAISTTPADGDPSPAEQQLGADILLVPGAAAAAGAAAPLSGSSRCRPRPSSAAACSPSPLTPTASPSSACAAATGGRRSRQRRSGCIAGSGGSSGGSSGGGGGGLAMSPATAAACRAAAAGLSPNRRRSAASSSQAAVVTFASGVSAELHQRGMRIVRSLGGTVAETQDDVTVTHLVAQEGKLSRSLKLLLALARGVPVVNAQSWLDACKESRTWVNPKDHLLQDGKLQEKTGASLLSAYTAAAAARDKGRSLLTGVHCLLAPGLLLGPDPTAADHLKLLITSAGGTVLETPQQLMQLHTSQPPPAPPSPAGPRTEGKTNKRKGTGAGDTGGTGPSSSSSRQQSRLLVLVSQDTGSGQVNVKDVRWAVEAGVTAGWPLYSREWLLKCIMLYHLDWDRPDGMVPEQ